MSLYCGTLDVWRKSNMKIKSMFAALAAGTIAVSALAVSAFAGELAIANATEADGKYAYHVGEHLPAGRTFADVYGAEIKISGVDTAKGAGGGIIFQSDSVNWNQKEWGDEGSDKDYKFNYTDFTFKRLESESPFSASDTWANIVISEWDGWGDPITVESVKLLDKDGNELTAAEETTAAPAETTAAAATTTTAAKAAAATTTAKDSGKKADSTKTGDAGVGIAVAALGLAGAAAFVARKKH